MTILKGQLTILDMVQVDFVGGELAKLKKPFEIRDAGIHFNVPVLGGLSISWVGSFGE